MKKKAMVRVEPLRINFPNTYMGTRSRYAIQIFNESSEQIHFEFRKFASQFEEKSFLIKENMEYSTDAYKKKELLEYKNDNFSFQPKEGNIWPKRFVTVIIDFHPKIPGPCNTQPTLYVEKFKERHTFLIKALCTPPSAKLDISGINIGCVELGQTFEYQVNIRNTGEIPCEFTVDNFKSAGIKFDFEPNNAIIPIGESIPVRVKFCAGQVVSFNETFDFKIAGATVGFPSLNVFGKVIGPECAISVNSVDFGMVTSGVISTFSFDMVNKSNIAFDYSWYFPDDGSFAEREFNIVPSGGTISGFEKVSFLVELMPLSARKIEERLVLDVSNYSRSLISVPVKADIITPTCLVSPDFFDLGEVYVNSPLEVCMKLKNSTIVSAHYEFIEPSGISATNVSIKPRNSSGEIPANSEIDFSVVVLPTKLGPIDTYFKLLLMGSDSLIPVHVKAVSVGPKLDYSLSKIDFGKSRVLTEQRRVLQIKNESTIDAELSASIEHEMFSVSPEKAVISPGQTLELSINCFLIDMGKFNTELVCDVKNLPPVIIPVKAAGIGVPIVPSINFERIDCGPIITEHDHVIPFSITNKGLRACSVAFTCQKPKTQQNEEIVFTITPSMDDLEPGDTHDFALTLNCKNYAVFESSFQCHATIGQTRVVMFQPMVTGKFMHPKLSFSSPTISFVHSHNYEEEERIGKQSEPNMQLLPKQEQNITIQNKSLFKAVFDAICKPPFSLSKTHFEMEPLSNEELTITFNVDLKKDFFCDLIKQKIVFDFNHSKKFSFMATAEYQFPNVAIDDKEIDFGVLLTNSEKIHDFTIKNESPLPVIYHWTLGTTSDAFDVFPIRGRLEPGELAASHIQFVAKNEYAENKAIMHVDGGPDYEISLCGGSSLITYDIFPQTIDFESKRYSQVNTTQVFVENTSRCPFSFETKIDQVTDLSILIEPMEATVQPNEKVPINVTVRTPHPGIYKDRFVICVGGVQDIEILILVDAQFDKIEFVNEGESQTQARAIVPENEKEKTVDERFAEFLRELPNNSLQSRSVSKLSKSSRTREIASKQFIENEYTVDFGQIILGDSLTRKLTLKSGSKIPVKGKINSEILRDTGFTITPTDFLIEPEGNTELSIDFATENRSLGPEEFEATIPINFSDRVVSNIIIKSNIDSPLLEVSSNAIDFEEVIVGQWRTITIQLKNPNEIECQYEIKCASTIFSTDAEAGTMPAKSFTNIGFIFKPKDSKEYNCTFDICISHNEKPLQVECKGTGERLKLTFDPPSIVMPPVLPFTQPVKAEVTIINNSKHHVEVFSHQFDFKKYVNERQGKDSAQHSQILEIEENKPQRFVPCVIVHGTRLSGKTTISNIIAEKLGGVPILDLKEVWKDIKSDAGADYISAVSAVISQPEYDDGFVVDGLNAFDEKDNNDFLQKSIKTKNAFDELSKNPFKTFSHEQLTGTEKSLSFLLNGLDGQSVLFVAIQLAEDALPSRIQGIEKEEKRKKEVLHQQKKQELIEMTEEEYLALSEKEREAVDKKRKASRERSIKKIIDAEEARLAKEAKEAKKRKSKSNEKKDRSKSPSEKKKESDDKKKKEEKMKEEKKKEEKAKDDKKKDDKKKEEPPKERKKKKITSVPTDPDLLELVTFQFTLGTMVQMVENPLETFLVCDPTNVLKKDPISIPNVCIQHINSLLIYGENTLEQIQPVIDQFLPDIDVLENAVHEKFLPPIKTGILLKEVPEIYTKRPMNFMINEEITFEPPNTHDSGRKTNSGRLSRKGKSRDVSGIPFIDEIDLADFTPRWKIDPNEKKTINISFTANVMGTYEDNFYFGISSSKAEVFKLPLLGECKYPEIDRQPEHLFAKVVPKALKSTKEAFAINTQTYYFGTLLVSKEKQSKTSIPPYKTQISLKNNSQFPAEIHCSIMDSPNKAPWSIDVTKATVAADNSLTLTVGLYPNVTGSYSMTLLICVKDNPEPLQLEFKAEASNPQLEFSTPLVDFGRTLLKKKVTQEVVFRNNGTSPISWCLKHSNQNTAPFTITPTEGSLDAKKTETVTFGFSSTKSINAKKAFIFDFFDQEKTKQYGISSITLQGEAFDSAYDLIYPPKTSSLVFGVLKVNQSKTLQVSLKSRGKYPASYLITIQQNLQQYIKCSPTSGTIQPGDKAIVISFSFIAQKCVNFNNVKIATLAITDTTTNVETYKNEIFMQVSTVYNSYEIDKVVDFESVQVSTNKVKILKLKNTGSFPLDFNLSMKQEPPKSKIVKGKVVPIKPPPLPKPKMRKGQGMQLPIGPFIVCPSQGVVQPNSTINISVELTHPQVEVLNTVALIKTTDEDPQKPGTKEVLFKANVVSPAIFNTDYEPIFAGLHLCLRSDVKKNNVTAFLEDEHMVHFAPLMLGKKQTIKARMINPTPIPITVDVGIKGKQKNVSNSPWELGTNVVEVKPNSFTELPITFAPTAEGIFQTFIEANVRGSTNPKTKLLKFALEGNGALPSVTTEKVKQIALGRVIVGSTRERSVVIRNDGYIPAHVTISYKASLGFTLKDEETTEYDMDPGRQQVITVVFAPQKIQRSTFEVTATVADNPKNVLVFNFVGEGYLDDVIFEGGQQPSDDSDVSFTNTVVGRKSELSFVVKNICQKDIRFMFPAHHDFTFLPRCGYIRAGKQKSINISFYSDKPVKYQGAKLPVQWSKIEIPSDVDDWDDSMKAVSFNENGQKTVQAQKEPAIKIIPPKQKDLIFRVSAISDVIKYTIDTKEIEFAPTMMYQTRLCEVRLSNISSIRLEYSWELEKFSALRTEYASVRKPCFTISPSQGTIDGGSTTVFKVRFKPEEVDDFTAEFVCKIPFLAQMQPPTLSLSGISRRPLCHFDVEPSDYLTRRHPAYSDIPLPEGVLVIEIFSRKVGSQSIKKFDIVNPTSSPYEVQWSRVDDSTRINALNPSALISSGKRYSFSFSYSPASVKTIESLWTFSIPVHNIVKHILFVGRIVPE